MKEPIVYGTPTSTKFASDLASALECENGRIEHTDFPDGEHEFEFLDSCRGRAAIVVGSSQMPAKNWELLKGFCHKAKRLGAKRIILVVPYFGFSRQDYAKTENKSEMMSVRGRELSGFAIDCIILIDLHNPASVSKIRVRGDDRELLSASKIFISKIRELGLENAIAASPDVGRLNVVRDVYAVELKIPAVSGDKHRVKKGLEYFGIIGRVPPKATAYLIDDIIDSGGTLIKAAEALKNAGAEKVIAFATHAVLSGDAQAKLLESPIEKIYITDTIEHRGLLYARLETLSVVPLFAERIKEIL